jgi:hypothetical protein
MMRPACVRLVTRGFDAIHENVATKQDLALVKAAIRTLELRLTARIDAVEHGLNQRIDRMIDRLGSLMVVLLGLLFGALHYWPPHG